MEGKTISIVREFKIVQFVRIQWVYISKTLNFHKKDNNKTYEAKQNKIEDYNTISMFYKEINILKHTKLIQDN